MNPNILLLESISDSAKELLDTNATVQISPTPESGSEALNIDKIDAIVTRGKGKVDQSLICACANLKVIARCGVGLDNIDVDMATKKGVIVINAPGVNAATVAEHTLALMLISNRKIWSYVNKVKMGHWAKRKNYNGDELRNKTLGILGFGDIGRRVANLADAFGMRVIFWNRSKVVTDFKQVGLDHLYEKADIISLHLPSTPSTEQIISYNAISRMKNAPILVNTSRGQLVHEEALIDALKAGKVASYAADLLSSDPTIKQHPLLSLENVLITPHIASLTATTYEQMCQLTVQNVLDMLAGNTIDEKYIFNNSAL